MENPLIPNIPLLPYTYKIYLYNIYYSAALDTIAASKLDVSYMHSFCNMQHPKLTINYEIILNHRTIKSSSYVGLGTYVLVHISDDSLIING